MRFMAFLNKLPGTHCTPISSACISRLMSISLALLLTSSFAYAAQAKNFLYGTWSYECSEKRGKEKESCMAKHLVADKNAKQAVLGVMVGLSSEQSLPHMTFRFSAKANVDKGAAVKVDEFQSFNVKINRCDEKICEIRSYIPADLLSQMKNGKHMLFAFYLEEQQVTFPVSLDGFSEAFKALQTASK